MELAQEPLSSESHSRMETPHAVRRFSGQIALPAEDQWPGNEGPFYHSRGIHPNEVEPMPENAPQMANAMLEALAHHNCRQSEARDRQEYQRQQDNTESLMADFPSPMLVDQDEPTDLEGLGTTVAPQPSSSMTTVPSPSSSTTLALAKKKISIEEYNHRKAVE